MKHGQSLPDRGLKRYDAFGNVIDASCAASRITPWVGGSLNASSTADWARYFVDFFKEYASRGVPFWGATVQNEPAKLPPDEIQQWETMFWSNAKSKDSADTPMEPFVTALRRALDDAELTHLRLMVHDDQKVNLPTAVQSLLPLDAVDGVGVHWYMSPPLEDVDRNNHCSFDSWAGEDRG